MCRAPGYVDSSDSSQPIWQYLILLGLGAFFAKQMQVQSLEIEGRNSRRRIPFDKISSFHGFLVLVDLFSVLCCWM